MDLIARVTIVTKTGKETKEVPPGGTFSVKDKAEAESLVARGLAQLPAVDADAEAKAKAEADAKAKAEAEALAKAQASQPPAA